MAISRSRLRIRRGLPVICHYAARLPRARSALAMTNLIASRRRMRAAKIANLPGAHSPQGARRTPEAAELPRAAQKSVPYGCKPNFKTPRRMQVFFGYTGAERRRRVPRLRLSLSKNYPNGLDSGTIEETGVFSRKTGEKTHSEIF